MPCYIIFDIVLRKYLDFEVQQQSLYLHESKKPAGYNAVFEIPLLDVDRMTLEKGQTV